MKALDALEGPTPILHCTIPLSSRSTTLLPKDYFRDEYVTSARWGFGVQRLDTLGVVISSATQYIPA